MQSRSTCRYTRKATQRGIPVLGGICTPCETRPIGTNTHTAEHPRPSSHHHHRLPESSTQASLPIATARLPVAPSDQLLTPNVGCNSNIMPQSSYASTQLILLSALLATRDTAPALHTVRRRAYSSSRCLGYFHVLAPCRSGRYAAAMELACE